MDVGTPELLIILVVVVLLLGGKQLPEIARGSGRALRLFKAEVSGLDDPTAHATVRDDPAGGEDDRTT